MSAAQQAQQSNRHADGRYAEKAGFDPGDLALGDDQTWGTVNVNAGSRTPWGEAQQVTRPAPGIAFVSCAGHGGFKLSTERNAAIPVPLRRRSGWYEEDCEADIVAMFHPEAFPGDTEAVRDRGRHGAANWFPSEFEAATGETIEFGASAEKDRAAWTTRHQGEPCLYTEGATESSEYPGVVIVTTSTVGGNSFTTHMIPVNDYVDADNRRTYGAATVRPLLPRSAVDVTVNLAAPPAPTPHTGVDESRASNSRIAASQLDKLWRDRDGRVFTLRGDISAGRFSGKHRFYDPINGWQYRFEATSGGGTVIAVNKAAFDAYTAPDSTPTSEVTYGKYLAVSRRAQDRTRRPSELAKLASEAETLREQARRELDAERAAETPRRELDAAALAAAEKAARDRAYATLTQQGFLR